MEKTINNINYNDYIKFETSLSDKEYKSQKLLQWLTSPVEPHIQ